MPTPFHIECEGERLGEGKEGEFPLGSRDKTWSRVYGEPKQGWELISQFHRLISRAFTVIEGMGGRAGDYAYPPYRLHHQITCQIMALICILSTRNLDQIGNESK